MRRIDVLLVCVSGVAALLAGAPTARAEQVIGAELRGTTLSAYRGWVVWSSLDARSRNFRLVAYHDGSSHILRVRPSATQFRADLGADAHGHLVAVYSRCTPRCDIYSYGLTSHREQKLVRFSSARGDELLPSISGRQIAFVRYRGPRVRGGSVEIDVADVGGRYLQRIHVGVAPRTTALPEGVLSLDLRAGQLAYVWSRELDRCGALSDPIGPFSQLWLVRVGQRPRLVEGGCAASETEFWPVTSLPNGAFYTLAAPANPSDPSAMTQFRLFDPRAGKYYNAPTGYDFDHFGSGGATTDGSSVYFSRSGPPPRRTVIVQQRMPNLATSTRADRRSSR